MTKKNRKTRRIRKRHNASNFMPTIQPNPTLNKDNIDKLPKIIVDCQADLDDRDINKIKVRLNFTDHKDLRKLHGIRVVDPDTIKMPSKESTTGCYHPGNKSGRVEIWLSSELIKTPKGEITLKEFSELMGMSKTESRKKKWTHPLNKKRYRDRFKIPER